MFLQDNDFLLIAFSMQVRPWQAGFDWPIYIDASNRAGHDKQPRKMLITRENHEIKAE